jgi:hypothetical protein
MKASSKRQKLMSAAGILCLVVAGVVSAFAIPAKEVARSLNIQEFTAQCCVVIGPTVQVNEPDTLQPVVVTWSADYIVADTSLFEMSLNGGPCAFYGSGEANIRSGGTGSSFVNGTYQWAVFPADGLRKGLNSFSVCAGGFGKPVTIDIGSSVLAVRFAK